ncbi:methylthioribulose 1-phosphate dehydratase [Aphanothece hegewaldii CCALA 016]|uniref:Methylthioribulose-1-phosphate dehydratase n=1 Tax=Aphanothece hegewaldii CCALA 016 TaxID=2107694 RepID=A0A2T1LV63_9CHRO|nr:methylthioribulose 1-phosphate dehydratase [Aphanothece hegewaldii]PSF35575.1 methylthioribulose 1-phosphate dehydratase [Aphanothece hegewaldii CCALA 016]
MNNDPRLELISSASLFYQQGWMVGTAGNLSARLNDGSFWITASGKSKGNLQENDFVRMNLEGEVLESPNPQNCPSAETSIHQAIYSLFSKANACYHVHSVEANLMTRYIEGDNLPLPPIEMVKGLGIWQENPLVTMPVFKNYLNVPQIAQEIIERFQNKLPDIPALLILEHGVTVWADSPEKAKNQIEIAEYLFRYILASHH